MKNKLPISEASRALHAARKAAQLSLRALANRAATSHATLSAYEQGHKVPSIDVFLRILAACGVTAEFCLDRRVREAGGLPRGDELAEVLRLADQFPVRKPSPHIERSAFPG